MIKRNNRNFIDKLSARICQMNKLPIFVLQLIQDFNDTIHQIRLRLTCRHASKLNITAIDRYWFLSIDEATKTFGHCIVSVSKIDLNLLWNRLETVRNIVTTRDSTQIKFAENMILDIENTIKNFITLNSCATVDLIPDKKDKDISLVERIQSFRKYVDTKLEPEIKKIIPANVKLNVPLEFIMGSNHKANAICSSAIYAFSNYNIIIVKPVYKNQIHFTGCDETYLAHWQGQYKTSYEANKKHCIALFQHISKNFNLDIRHLGKKEISHVADAFMGIFGIFWANRQNELK